MNKYESIAKNRCDTFLSMHNCFFVISFYYRGAFFYQIMREKEIFVHNKRRYENFSLNSRAGSSVSRAEQWKYLYKIHSHKYPKSTTQVKLYSQLASSSWHDWVSRGYSWRFMGQDNVREILWWKESKYVRYTEKILCQFDSHDESSSCPKK